MSQRFRRSLRHRFLHFSISALYQPGIFQMKIALYFYADTQLVWYHFPEGFQYDLFVENENKLKIS
ncbi:TPA: hypothetical protein DCG86_01560 [Candidatus Marinimicrobia bacterium]|nr:MAG: hypothetical protein XD77_0830 [Marinimicrobia bacterium 46_47]KUK90063.1 MAG: hypothetical protein XE04_1603 [Marinimicrobia bacterium 46_43]HAE86689.1 hypothetical protein [Candidatus Neomarinimicrobiota bacterium]HBY17626.1 hypothetical protein [Candidatus Neomarinimicrobiota bacterium]